MIIRITAAIAMVAALGGCDRFKSEEPAAKTQAPAKPAPKKNINPPVEDALAQIPPAMRITYQKAFACEVKRNNAVKDSKAINVTPDYVRDLMERLKEKPGLADC